MGKVESNSDATVKKVKCGLDARTNHTRSQSQPSPSHKINSPTCTCPTMLAQCACAPKVTAEGFLKALSGDTRGALLTLAEGLCGVGPATASALLAAATTAPLAAAAALTTSPFMSDEAMEGCGLKRDYTVTKMERKTAR